MARSGFHGPDPPSRLRHRLDRHRCLGVAGTDRGGTSVHTQAAGGGTDDITLATESDAYVRMSGLTRKTMYGFSLYKLRVYGDKDETWEPCQLTCPSG